MITPSIYTNPLYSGCLLTHQTTQWKCIILFDYKRKKILSNQHWNYWHTLTLSPRTFSTANIDTRRGRYWICVETQKENAKKIYFVCDAWKIECRLYTIAYRVHWTSQQMFLEFHVSLLIGSVIAVCARVWPLDETNNILKYHTMPFTIVIILYHCLRFEWNKYLCLPRPKSLWTISFLKILNFDFFSIENSHFHNFIRISNRTILTANSAEIESI